MTNIIRGIPEDTPLGLGNCAIVACATISGLPYATVEPVVREAIRHYRGKPPSGRWKGSMHKREWEKSLTDLGVDWGQYPLGDRTLAHFVKTAPKGWPFMVWTRNHAMTVSDGLVFDQSHALGVPVDQHRQRRYKLDGCLFVRREA